MNQNYKDLKIRAIILRNKGFSYGEIEKKISVPKSTLSYWLKYIPLNSSQKERFYTKQIQVLSLGPQSQRERRKREVEKIISRAVREIRIPLTLDTHRLIGAALYWAEGSKGHRFQITNSDPHLILFMVKWLKKVFNINPDGLKAWLNIYPQQNSTDIKKFWSDLTNIPLENFGKTYVKPLSSGFKKSNLYYGTIRIEVPKSVDMKHTIFGWVKAVIMDIESETEIIQAKWERLTGIERPINL